MSSLAIRRYEKYLSILRSDFEPLGQKFKSKLASCFTLEQRFQFTRLRDEYARSVEAIRNRPEFVAAFDEAEQYHQRLGGLYRSADGETGRAELAEAIADFRKLSDDAKLWLSSPSAACDVLSMPRLIAWPEDGDHWPERLNPERLAYIDMFEKKIAGLSGSA